MGGGHPVAEVGESVTTDNDIDVDDINDDDINDDEAFAHHEESGPA
jgi:hypothetical protein